MTDRGAHWQDVYAGKAETEVSWFQPRPAVSLDFIAHGGFGPEARIVDVGGGASTLVDALLDQGFRDLTVLDIAPAALDRAKARLGGRAAGVDWVAADVGAWRPSAAFDLWHDRAVFHFLTDEDDRRAYRATLAAALRPGGQAILATFAPDGPERCSGLPVRRWSADELAAEFAPHFTLAESLAHEHVTPAGKVQRFTWVRLASPSATHRR
ncbi:MAG: class I SAM-dependent methyltransferase [Alphaproteobacteria bacterium]|nr:class I SAM-dependent methyltransferase [Alphaproteobacteria bacterium]